MSVDMKKVIIAIISIMCFTISVNADNYVAVEGDSKFSTYMTQYDKGIQKASINGSGIVTLYGYSDCDGSSCTYKYSKTSSDYKEVLKSTVTCTGGEKYIIYQPSGAADGYKTSNSSSYNGDAYWSEDFSITCTETQNSSTITLNNEVSPGGQTGGGTSSNGSATGEYGSSTTTENSGTGVETYYIVLGIVGIISYVIMNVVKKQNLFKNI